MKWIEYKNHFINLEHVVQFTIFDLGGEWHLCLCYGHVETSEFSPNLQVMDFTTAFTVVDTFEKEEDAWDVTRQIICGRYDIG